MPCLNEARTLGACISKAQDFLKKNGVSGEVIVADNGSTDGSIEIAAKLNARVVNVPVRGYGAALAAGIQAAKGKYIIMGDSDESYDFSALTPSSTNFARVTIWLWVIVLTEVLRRERCRRCIVTSAILC